MSRITVGIGKVNFPNTVVSLALFKVEAPFNRISGLTSARARIGHSVTYNFGAIQDYGMAYTNTIEHDEGTILLLQSSWSRGISPVREGGIFIRLREEAPQWTIEAKIPTDAENRIGDRFMVFLGRGDILDVEALARIGVEPYPQYVNRYLQDEEIDECYLIECSKAGTPPPILKSISTPEGIKIVEVEPERKRRIIRRG